MIPFNKNIPLIPTFKNVSQGNLLSNNIALNSTFGADHYAFDAIANKGKHNQVTQVQAPRGIPTTLDDCKIFANTITENTALLQFSKSKSNNVPSTPLTTIQSSTDVLTILAEQTEPIYDFNGLTRAIAVFYAYDNRDDSPDLMCEQVIFWYKNQFITSAFNFDLTQSSKLVPGSSKSIFQLTNNQEADPDKPNKNSVHIFWTIKFLRMEV